MPRPSVQHVLLSSVWLQAALASVAEFFCAQTKSLLVLFVPLCHYGFSRSQAVAVCGVLALFHTLAQHVPLCVALSLCFFLPALLTLTYLGKHLRSWDEYVGASVLKAMSVKRGQSTEAKER